MVNASQQAYEAYHSPECRAHRTAVARATTDAAVSEAHRLFFAGDPAAARHILFLAGLMDEGIDYYLDLWTDETR